MISKCTAIFQNENDIYFYRIFLFVPLFFNEEKPIILNYVYTHVIYILVHTSSKINVFINAFLSLSDCTQ
jgi:hypothetical protein